MEFIVDGQRIATENFLVGQIYEIIYKNENKVYAMCQGIGSDFVMFIANNPRVITLNLETAQTIDEIMPAEAASMYDYDDLINKPTINNIELIGNLSSSDLGLQSTLTTAQMTAVNSGIDSTKVEQIATNTTAIGNKQDVIDSSHMLSADLVDDSSSTNKFATAAQLAQIGTNENNILMLNKYGGGKNKYSIDATVTGDVHVDATKTSTGYQLSANGSWAHMDQEVILPSAGRYVISMTISNYNSVASSYAPSIIICPTSSISAPYLGSVIIEGNGEIVLTVETTNPVLYISYYINRSASETPTSSFEASNVMLCSESDWLISHDYQPYAMSNAEITAWILAHS